MAKSAAIDSQITYEQMSMDRITSYRNMAQMGFTPIKARAKKLNLRKEAAMRTAILDSTLGIDGIQDTVDAIPGKFQPTMMKRNNVDIMKRRTSNPQYKGKPYEMYFTDNNNNYFVQTPRNKARTTTRRHPASARGSARRG